MLLLDILCLRSNLNVNELGKRIVLCVHRVSQGENHKASKHDWRHQTSKTKVAKAALACRLPRKSNRVISWILNERADKDRNMFPCCSGMHCGEYCIQFVLLLQHYIHLYDALLVVMEYMVERFEYPDQRTQAVSSSPEFRTEAF